MEFNRIISLVLGFIILILAFVWISNKFRAKNPTTQLSQPTATIIPTIEKKQSEKWNPLSFLFDDKTSTPTPTKSKNIISTTNGEGQPPTPQVQISIIEGRNAVERNGSTGQTTATTNNTNSIYNKKSIQQIPETGSPTVLIPILTLFIAGGFAIRKTT